MVSIGIRATSKEIYYAVLDEENGSLDIDTIKVPKALDDPGKLSFIRNNLNTLILKCKIKKGAIRVNETISQNIDPFRIMLEGVILELFAGSTIEKYFLGRASNTSAKIDLAPSQTKVKDLIQYIDLELDGIQLNDYKREAIVMAYVAGNL